MLQKNHISFKHSVVLNLDSSLHLTFLGLVPDVKLYVSVKRRVQ